MTVRGVERKYGKLSISSDTGEKMTDQKPSIGMTRRDFIANTSKAAIGSALLMGTTGKVFPGVEETKSATVVMIRDRNVLDANRKVKYDVVLDMLDKAVTTLTGKDDPVGAWKTIIKPGDVVGIKTNEWERLSTPAEVENVLKKRVMDAGVPEANIGIGDRQVLSIPVFQKTTALINTRPIRSHHWAGVGTLIKNYVMFEPNPPDSPFHDDACSRLAELWEYPIVKGKTRLNVLVMLTPQIHSTGPHGFHPRYLWPYYGLIVGFDPVAVDSTGVRILQAARRAFFGDDRPLNPPPKHIFLADTRYKLGTADPNKIKLIKLGYEKDAFI